jgi:hypothetical protein
MAEPAYNPDTDRRQSPRHVGLRKQVQLESAVFFEPVMLIDIGRRGFSVQTIIAYPTGTPLKLHLEGHGVIKGTAVWHAKQRLGARFEEPLADEVLAGVLG